MTNKEAMQMALDALEFDGFSPQDLYHRQLVMRATEAIRAALAQGEQEPYGYLWFTRYMEHRFTHRIPEENERIGDVKPVYATPPQRPWQGLTDDDVEEQYWAWEDMTEYPIPLFEYRAIARAIEANLKGKNNG